MHYHQDAETNGRKSLSTQAYEAIYRRIITLAYEPGMHLEENQIVETLGIGRTPVREALQRLTSDLLVESQLGKGFIVRPLTLQNTKAAFNALRILELGVAELCVRQDVSPFIPKMVQAGDAVKSAVATMDIYRLVESNSIFHDLYAQCSRNVFLVDGLRKVRCETNRLAWLSYGNEIDPEQSLQEHYTSVIGQHTAIIEAIKQRDEQRLKRVVLQHIETFQNRMISYLTSF